MPIPQPKDNEKQNDYMGRCMHKVNKDNPKMENKQQVAICLNTYSNPKKKSKANEIEVDFTEDIKNMNKIKEPTNTAVTAPAPEIKAQDNIVDIPDDQNTESLDGEKIQTAMLQMQKQYQIFHWQTTSFSQHKSFGKIYESLDENIDTFIETYMGKYGRVIAASKFNLEMSNYSDLNFASATDSYIEFLIGLNDMLDETRDSDLLNIRDEILGSLNQLKYLLTLV
jgi:DNA-binding ferritin-like protein